MGKRYVLVTKKLELFLRNVFQRNLIGKELNFNGKYISIDTDKIDYHCKDVLEKNDIELDYSEFVKWYYSEKTNFVIDKNVPIPKRSIHYSALPFEIMDIGDSFFVSKGKFKYNSLLQLRAFLYRKAKEYVVENFIDDKFIFSIDRSNGGIRCFRIE